MTRKEMKLNKKNAAIMDKLTFVPMRREFWLMIYNDVLNSQKVKKHE